MTESAGSGAPAVRSAPRAPLLPRPRRPDRAENTERARTNSAGPPGDPRPRRPLLLGMTVLVGLVAGAIAMASCARGDSAAVRVEGPVPTRAGTPSAPSVRTAPIGEVDAVDLLTAEPGIPEAVKADLRLCGDEPGTADTEYGDLTRDGVRDALVTVRGCAGRKSAGEEGAGVYVFSNRHGRDEMVFDLSVSGIAGVIRGGDLLVTRTVPRGDGETSYPVDADQVRYSWNGQTFQPVARSGGTEGDGGGGSGTAEDEAGSE